jgi:hypothetical protein
MRSGRSESEVHSCWAALWAPTLAGGTLLGMQRRLGSREEGGQGPAACSGGQRQGPPDQRLRRQQQAADGAGVPRQHRPLALQVKQGGASGGAPPPHPHCVVAAAAGQQGGVRRQAAHRAAVAPAAVGNDGGREQRREEQGRGVETVALRWCAAEAELAVTWQQGVCRRGGPRLLRCGPYRLRGGNML